MIEYGKYILGKVRELVANHITLRRGSTSFLSQFHEPYGACVALMWFSIVLSLLLRWSDQWLTVGNCITIGFVFFVCFLWKVNHRQKIQMENYSNICRMKTCKVGPCTLLPYYSLYFTMQKWGNILIKFVFLIKKALWKMGNNEEAMCKVPLCMVFLVKRLTFKKNILNCNFFFCYPKFGTFW